MIFIAKESTPTIFFQCVDFLYCFKNSEYGMGPGMGAGEDSGEIPYS